MIKVNRNKVAPPPVLVGVGSLGERERQTAVDFFSKKGNRGKPFGGYAAYSKPPVKASLNALFHYKCAYCEMDYGGAPLDVEHFRPKAAIVEIDVTTWKAQDGAQAIKPGYYWLGAEWTNLLPSCIDCNRRREHAFEVNNSSVTGKGNYFPLEHGSSWVLDHNKCNLAMERPLLLDPCSDDPEDHLKFGPQGVIISLSLRGTATIQILGLQRDLLVRQRKQVESQVLFTIEQAKSACTRVLANTQDASALQDLGGALVHLKQIYLQPSSRFLAMSTQLVTEHLPTALRSLLKGTLRPTNGAH